jgi:hypothetical protein
MTPPSHPAAALPALEAVPTSGLAWASRLLFEAPGVAVHTSEANTPSLRPAVQSFLVLPRPATPRLLVPLESRVVAAAAVRRADRGSHRIVRTGLAVGLRVGAGPHLGRRLDVVADPSCGNLPVSGALLRDHLRDVLDQADLELAVILGPPRLNRKPVLQLLDRRGRVIGYAKAAWNQLTRRLVRNEALTLMALMRAAPANFVAPRLLHHGRWGELELIVTSALAPATGGHRAGTMAPPIAAIHEIARQPGVTTALLSGSGYWAGVEARLAERRRVLAGEADPLAPLAAFLVERHGDMPLRFGGWHGDLTPWNLSVHRRSIHLWDWERAALPVPLGLDLAHFVYQQTARKGHNGPVAAFAPARRHTRTLLDRAGLHPGSDDALWLIYGLELLFRYEEARLAGALVRASAIHSAVFTLFKSAMETRS